MKKIIENFRRGKKISDRELSLLVDHYYVLDGLLDHHGDMYWLVAKDVAEEYHRAKDMYQARFKKPWKP